MVENRRFQTIIFTVSKLILIPIILFEKLCWTVAVCKKLNLEVFRTWGHYCPMNFDYIATTN